MTIRFKISTRAGTVRAYQGIRWVALIEHHRPNKYIAYHTDGSAMTTHLNLEDAKQAVIAYYVAKRLEQS